MTADITALAIQYGRYGYRRIAAMLDRGDAWRPGLGGERQTGRTDLATRGAEGSRSTTQARASLAERGLMYRSAAGAPQPCLVLRLRRGSNP